MLVLMIEGKANAVIPTKAIEGEVVKKHAGGRPTKLTPEVIAKAWDYLNRTANISKGELLPTIEGLALATGVHRDTLQEWEKDVNNEFSVIVKQLRQAQAEKLIQNALVGNYNPMIAKLLLSKHGYVEKQEIDQSISLVQPIIGGMAKAKVEDEQAKLD